MANGRNRRPAFENLADRITLSASVHADLGCERGGSVVQGEVTLLNIRIVQASGEARRRVFLVHGRNEGVREGVARFLQTLGLPFTILHEQPNEGRTIIEKFEDYSDVGFAVVLLTGDDKGGLANESPKSYQLRARQNVIFELGFFVGKLGRGRVCCLHESGVEPPSDIKGIVSLELDAKRHWQVELAKELKAAGFDVDMNRFLL